jgi:hypothetical protein
VPNCDFYALATDLVEVLDFIFSQSGWSLFELASRPDQPLREFPATRELLEAHPTFDLLEASLHFQLYCPTMGGRVSKRRIDFKAGAVPGATFRYDAEGWRVGATNAVSRALRCAPSTSKGHTDSVR